MAAGQTGGAQAVRSRRAWYAALVGLVLVAGPAQREPAQGAVDETRPRLVLFVSVDQLRFENLLRFESLYRGGFRTLLDRGAVFTNALYRHANTETGPGHAVLLSGRNGRHSGIIANEWYDPLTRTMMNVVEDPAQAPVTGNGRGASPVNFEGFTVGDMLKRASPGSRVVGVSLKDRSAVLMGGHRADAAYWYDSGTGTFTSSTYYMNALPEWLTAWNAEHHADRAFGKTWTRLLPDESVYRRLAGEDAVEGEWDGDNVFPHAIRGKAHESAFYDDLRRTPYADELILEVALGALDAYTLGRRDATDLLAVGFSANDAIGHTYGPDSQEVMDEMLRLDLLLQTLLEKAEVQAGRGRVLVALSADHGSSSLVETVRRRGQQAWRVAPTVFEAAVTKALAVQYPRAQGLVAKVDAPHVYLDLEAIRRHGLTRRSVEAAVAKALMSTGFLERTYTHADLSGDPPTNDPAFFLFRNSFYAPRSPHVMSRLKDNVYISPQAGGTGHGTHHDHDRHVPIVFMGARITPGRYEQACGPEDIAPTLGKLLDLAYPLQDAERLLSEMIR